MIDNTLDDDEAPHVNPFIFYLNDSLFSILSAHILEVHPVYPVRRLPLRNEGSFLGVTAIQGEVLVSVSLHKLLNIPPGSPKDRIPHYPGMLELHFNKKRLIAYVNYALGNFVVPETDLSAVTDKPYISSVFIFKQKPVFIIDIAALFKGV